MTKILAISSFVACGHVGLSAMGPALQHWGHEVIALPTVVLSNHPAHPHSAGFDVACTQLRTMLDALDANGWLADIAAIITGYLPTTRHVAFAKSAVERVRKRNPSVLYVCDPILGDDPKGLYLEATAAEAIKTSLVPAANVLTPNRFELEWLSGRPVSNALTAVRASRTLPCAWVVTTSVPDGTDNLANVWTSRESAAMCSSTRLETAPKGTGDVFTGLLTGQLLAGLNGPAAMAKAAACVASTVALSQTVDELQLLASRADWHLVDPCPLSTVEQRRV